jgi:Flp pilus assembly protein TadG
VRGHRPRPDEQGAVTAEAAVVLPVLALFTVALVWMICVGLTQVRAMDAAREVARAAARADSAGEATALGRQVAPAGSSISLRRGEATVVATVSSPVRGPAGIVGRLAGLHVTGRAVAALEPDQ